MKIIITPIWSFYYIFLFTSFIIGIIVFLKTKRRTGVITTILIPVYIICSFCFILYRDWVNGQTELQFFIQKLKELSIEGISLLVLFIMILFLSVYHIIVLEKRKKNEK